MEQGLPIDWNACREAGRDGRLMGLLAKLPSERWAEKNGCGITLLHCACLGPNAAAVVVLLQRAHLDVNARDKWGGTPAQYAAAWKQPCVLEVLCAAGADVMTRQDGFTPIEWATGSAYKDDGKSARVLIANGVRLSTVRADQRDLIPPELVAFERDVLRCRAAVVSILSVKREGNLWRWDKFLLREIAYAVWATRMCKQ